MLALRSRIPFYLPAMLAAFVWWFFLQPGLMSNDSLSTWNEVKIGSYNIWQTGLWPRLVWLLSLGGSHVGLATLCFSLGLIGSVAYWLAQTRMPFKGLTLFIMAVTP